MIKLTWQKDLGYDMAIVSYDCPKLTARIRHQDVELCATISDTETGMVLASTVFYPQPSDVAMAQAFPQTPVSLRQAAAAAHFWCEMAAHQIRAHRNVHSDEAKFKEAFQDLI